MPKPRRKITKKDAIPFWMTDGLIDAVVGKIARRHGYTFLKTFVTEMVTAEWENVVPTDDQIRMVVKTAKDRLFEKSKGNTEDNRATAIAFYESVLVDPYADMKDKLKAQERLDKILGLEDVPVDHRANTINKARALIIAIGEMNGSIGAPPSAKAEGDGGK